MLKIRKEQNDELAKAAVKRFEDWMFVHLNKFFPEHCKALGPKGTREAIHYAIESADSYEIVSERDVCKYTDLMFTFGRDFDKDPNLPWASGILNDENLKGQPTEKTNNLYKTAMRNVKQAGGIEAGTEA